MSEKIEVVCPQCQRLLKVPATAAGKRGRCPRCRSEFTIEPVVMLDPSAEVAGAGTSAGLEPVSPAGDPFAGVSPWGGTDPLGSSAWPPPPTAGTFTPAPGASALPPSSAWTPAPVPAPVSPASDYLRQAQRDLANDRSQKRHEALHGSGGGVNAGIIGGIIAMVLAVVWFVAGLFANRIFFYPPVMFVCGLITVIRGVAGLADDR